MSWCVVCVAQRRCFCALQAVEEVVKNAFREEERVSQFEPVCIIPLVCCELPWRSSTVQKFVDEPLHQGLVGRQQSVQEQAWAQLGDAQSTMSPCSYCKHYTMPYALSTRNFFTCTSKLLYDTKCVPLKKFFYFEHHVSLACIVVLIFHLFHILNALPLCFYLFTVMNNHLVHAQRNGLVGWPY